MAAAPAPAPAIAGVAIHVGAEGDPPLPLPSSSAALAVAASLVGRRLRVSLRDGRIVSGTLTCLDPQANVVLADAVTLADDAAGGGGDGRGGGACDGAREGHSVGTVIIPAAQRVACAVEVELHEQVEWEAAVARAVGTKD